MTARPYTEDQLVEDLAIQLFGELGWQTVPAMEEGGSLGGKLGRNTSGEVVLALRLRLVLDQFAVIVALGFGLIRGLTNLRKSRDSLHPRVTSSQVNLRKKYG